MFLIILKTLSILNNQLASISDFPISWNKLKTKILGVTLLTSLDGRDSEKIYKDAYDSDRTYGSAQYDNIDGVEISPANAKGDK